MKTYFAVIFENSIELFSKNWSKIVFLLKNYFILVESLLHLPTNDLETCYFLGFLNVSIHIHYGYSSKVRDQNDMQMKSNNPIKSRSMNNEKVIPHFDSPTFHTSELITRVVSQLCCEICSTLLSERAFLIWMTMENCFQCYYGFFPFHLFWVKMGTFQVSIMNTVDRIGEDKKAEKCAFCLSRLFLYRDEYVEINWENINGKLFKNQLLKFDDASEWLHSVFCKFR